MTDSRPILEKLNQVRAQLLAEAERIPAEQWKKRPAPEKWSAAEVIAHLTMVETAIMDGAEKLVRSEPRPVPFWKRLHLSPRLAEWRGIRAKTPIPLDPAFLGEKQPMLERFGAGRARVLSFLEANRERDLSRWRWRHPFFGSLNAYSWFRMIYHHEIRHTQQIQEIAKSL